MPVILPAVLLFLPLAMEAAEGTVTINFDVTTATGSPYVFGGVKFPQEAQQDDIYPKLVDAGVTSIRGDFYLEAIIPARLCASVDAYKKNINEIQNPDTWSYGHLYFLPAAKKSGLRNMVIAGYCPTWLSCNGKKSGVPKDWDVWEDIVKKVYARYQAQVDWVELSNEPDYGFFDIAGSPYATKADALVDIMYHTERAIRSVNPNAATGGFAFGWKDPKMLGNILSKAISKYGGNWVDNSLNFISWHQYGLDCGDTDTASMRAVLAGLGLNRNKPIFIDEWNHWDWHPKEDEPQAVEEIGFTGRALTKFVKNGVSANYYSLYPYNYSFTNVVYGDGKREISHCFYTVNSDGKSGRLLLQSYPFHVLSTRLGLGKGTYAVKRLYDQKVIDSCAAVNSDGQKTVFVANDYPHANSATIKLLGLSGRAANVVEYWAAGDDPGDNAHVTNTVAVINGTAVYSVSMDAQTCVGLIVKDGNQQN